MRVYAVLEDARQLMRPVGTRVTRAVGTRGAFNSHRGVSSVHANSCDLRGRSHHQVEETRSGRSGSPPVVSFQSHVPRVLADKLAAV